MYISFAESCAKGFKRWSDAHRRAGNDNDGDVPSAVAVAIAESQIDCAVLTSTETPHDPWRVPGVAHAF